MITARFMNELIGGIATIVEKITDKQIIIPHILQAGDSMDGHILKENFDAIIKAFDKK